MRVNLPAPPYSVQKLSVLFEAPIPEIFPAILNAISADCSNGEEAYKQVDDLLGWLLAGKDQRYDTTPAELFPIAGTGSDGGHIGYVIHAPEIPASDYPIARYEPMAPDEGIAILGWNTIDAINTEFSWWLREASSDYEWALEKVQSQNWQKIVDRLRPLGVNPTAECSEKYFTQEDIRSHYGPNRIPSDYRFVYSRDGIGVLAPRTTFHPDVVCETLPKRYDDELMIDIASTHLEDGFAGTALWQVRELLHRDFTCGPYAKDMIALMQNCYERLGRDILAKAMEYRLANIG